MMTILLGRYLTTLILRNEVEAEPQICGSPDAMTKIMVPVELVHSGKVTARYEDSFAEIFQAFKMELAKNKKRAWGRDAVTGNGGTAQSKAYYAAV